MKKTSRILITILTIAAILAGVFSLGSCGKKEDYPEIASSKKEATPIATLGGHEVRYELFRAYFSAMYSGKTDGMTETEWETAKTAVLREIALLYATLDVAEANGVDPYGDAVNDEVRERVRIDYEGGEANGYVIEGAGSREKYKEALAAANLTDAVNRLIYRYDATQAALYDYLVTNYAYGKDTGAKSDARAFFDSADCAHGVWVYVQYDLYDQWNGSSDARAFAEEQRSRLAAATDYSAVFGVLRDTFSDQVLSADEMRHGFYVSKNQGNNPLQRALVSDIFSLSPFACGEIREGDGGVWFAVGLAKDAADYDRDPNGFYDLMLEETEIDRPIAEKAETWLAGVSYSSAFPTFSAETLAELTVR